MADVVNVSSAPNNGLGDLLRNGFIKVNTRFNELLGTLEGAGAWATATAYTATPVRQWVLESGQAYVAIVNHTSGVFATDLAAGKWLAVDVAQLISDLAGTGGAAIVGADDGLSGALFANLQAAMDRIDWGSQEPQTGYNVLRQIPPAEWAAIFSRTSTFDATASINAAGAAHECLVFPDGTYRHTGLTFSLFGQCLKGTGNKYSGAILEYLGSGTAITFTSAVNYARMQAIAVHGIPTTGTDYYNTGSVGIDVTAGSVSIAADELWIKGFEALVLSNFNSFYNSFNGCRFEEFHYGLKNFSTNNMQVTGNRFVRFNTAVQGNGSNGPINLERNSFEVFNGPIYIGTGSEKTAINFIENYVELYDSTSLPTNFPASSAPNTTKFGGNILFTGPIGSFVSKGNDLIVGGAFRILSASSECEHIESVGNTLHLYTTNNNLDRQFSASSTISLHVNDRIGVVAGADGGYSRSYSQPVVAQSDPLGSYNFYDCITAKQLYPSTRWVAMTMQNAWTSADTTYGVARVARVDDYMILSGVIDGASKTDTTVFTVPAAYRPHEYGTTRSYASFQAWSGYGGGNIVRFRYLYASGILLQDGSPVSLATIALDGIVIPPRF